MRLLGMTSAVAIALLLVQSAVAQCNSCGAAAGCDCAASCDHGHGGGCCRLECTTKKITVTCYGCKCKDICLPCKSKKVCKHCETVGDCGKGGDCCEHNPLCCIKWTEWCPGGAKAKTVKQLVKYEVTKEVPSYKWVVDKGNWGCAAGGGVPAPAPAGGTEAPEPPPTAGNPSRVFVPAGTQLPPLPAGVKPSQVRGVVFESPADHAAFYGTGAGGQVRGPVRTSPYIRVGAN